MTRSRPNAAHQLPHLDWKVELGREALRQCPQLAVLVALVVTFLYFGNLASNRLSASLDAQAAATVQLRQAIADIDPCRCP